VADQRAKELACKGTPTGPWSLSQETIVSLFRSGRVWKMEGIEALRLEKSREDAR